MAALIASAGATRPTPVVRSHRRPREAHAGPAPLSFAQERFWRQAAETGRLQRCAAYRIVGPLDVRRSDTAWSRSCGATRCCDGIRDARRPAGRRRPSTGVIELGVVDLSAAADPERRAVELLRQTEDPV